MGRAISLSRSSTFSQASREGITCLGSNQVIKCSAGFDGCNITETANGRKANKQNLGCLKGLILTCEHKRINQLAPYRFNYWIGGKNDTVKSWGKYQTQIYEAYKARRLINKLMSKMKISIHPNENSAHVLLRACANWVATAKASPISFAITSRTKHKLRPRPVSALGLEMVQCAAYCSNIFRLRIIAPIVGLVIQKCYFWFCSRNHRISKRIRLVLPIRWG